jgi:hypothetical protein
LNEIKVDDTKIPTDFTELLMKYVNYYIKPNETISKENLKNELQFLKHLMNNMRYFVKCPEDKKVQIKLTGNDTNIKNKICFDELTEVFKYTTWIHYILYEHLLATKSNQMITKEDLALHGIYYPFENSKNFTVFFNEEFQKQLEFSYTLQNMVDKNNTVLVTDIVSSSSGSSGSGSGSSSDSSGSSDEGSSDSSKGNGSSGSGSGSGSSGEGSSGIKKFKGNMLDYSKVSSLTEELKTFANNLNVYYNLFDAANHNTNYVNMIKQEKYKNLLFIFNGNEKNSGTIGESGEGNAAIGESENSFGLPLGDQKGDQNSSDLGHKMSFNYKDKDGNLKTTDNISIKTHIDNYFVKMLEYCKAQNYTGIILPLETEENFNFLKNEPNKFPKPNNTLKELNKGKTQLKNDDDKKKMYLGLGIWQYKLLNGGNYEDTIKYVMGKFIDLFKKPWDNALSL